MAQSNIVLTPGANPSPVVKMGDSLAFTLNIFNSINDEPQLNSYLDITIPANWAFVQAKVGASAVTASDEGNRKYRISGLNITQPAYIDVTVYIRPLCDAKAEDNGELEYELYSSANTLLASKTTSVISYFSDPAIINDVSGVSSSVITSRPTDRAWTIQQTAINSYVKNIKIEITLQNSDTTEVKLHNFQYKKSDNTYQPINMATDLEKVGNNKYIIYLMDDAISRTNNNNGKLEKDEILELIETVSYNSTNCSKQAELRYQLYYGDGTDWCRYGTYSTNYLTVIAPSFSGVDIELVKDNVYPKSSTGTDIATGRGQRVYQITNGAIDPAAILRDLRVNIYTLETYYRANVAYTKVYTAYFTDAAGNRIAGTPAIPVYNNHGIPGVSISPSHLPYKYIVCFDSIRQGAIGGGVPLISNEANNRYDDLPAGESFYFAVEYDIQYQHVTPTPNNGFIVFHRVFGDLYYKDECNQYKKFSRNYSSAGSTNKPDTEVCVGQPITSVEALNIRPGETTRLAFTSPPFAYGLSRTGYLINTENIRTNPIYEHKIKVKLPVGFIYNPAVGVTIALTDVGSEYPMNGTYGDVTYDPGTNTLVITNKYNFTNTIVTRVGMIATNEQASESDKVVEVSYLFNCVGENPVTYAEYTVPVDFNQILPCAELELVDFVSERTTFGYTDKTMATLANRNIAGINLRAAGPHDNVSHFALIAANSNIVLGSNDRVKVRMSYESSQITPYFDFPDALNVATLWFKKNGTPAFVNAASIPQSQLTLSYSSLTHSVLLDLTDYVNNNTISLNAGDSVKVEFLSRTSDNIPQIATVISKFEMDTFIDKNGVIERCSPLLYDFTLYDYKLRSVVSGSGGANYYNGNETEYNSTSTAGSLLRWNLGNGATAGTEIFTKEFRPNALFDSISIEMNGLFQLKKIAITTNGNSGNANENNYLYMATIPESDWDVRYDNGKTYLTVHNPNNKYTSEFWGTYGNGYSLYAVEYSFIGTDDAMPNTTNADINADDYPTSVTPVERAVSNTSATYIVANNLWNYYKYNFISTAPNSNPLANMAEWDLRITNTSKWASTDGILPNSWIALESAAGILDEAWLYESDGTTLIGKFTKFADGKLWIKLGDIDITSYADYKLKASFLACGSVSTITARYGMSNVLYPDDPWTGYRSQHNTPRVYNTVETSLTITPAAIDFSTNVLDDADQIAAGRYEFCTPFTVETVFSNNTGSDIKKLKVRVRLPIGLELDTYQPEVKVNGAWSPYGGTIISGVGYADIVLPESISLKGIGSNEAQVTVKFKLKTKCGFIGNSVVFELSGENECGYRLTKLANTVPIRIGNDIIPVVTTTAVKINGVDATGSGVPVSYKNNAEGALSLNVDYQWENYSSDIMYAYVDVPKNLILSSGTLKSSDESYNVSFTEVTLSPPGDTIRRYRAKFETLMSFPGTYKAELLFNPVNPAEWDCALNTIKAWAAVTSELTCEAIQCDIFNITTEANAYFRYDKYNTAVTVNKALGSYAGSTYESVVINALVKNNTAVSYAPAVLKFYLNNDGTGKINAANVQATGTTAITINNIAANGSENLDITQNILTGEVCKLMLVMLREDNPYICEDIILPLDVGYRLADNEITVCRGVGVAIGDLPISGYTYSWMPTSYLSSTSVAQPVFSAPAIGPKETLKYTVNITRPSGCVVTDTVLVHVIGHVGNIIYVKKGATGTGESWASPLGELADALELAKEINTCGNSISQIWVAEGTYSPMYIDVTKDPMESGAVISEIDRAFVLQKDIKIYGGFPSNATDSENGTISDRNWAAYETILSGRFVNGGITDSVLHVVISAGDVGTARLDGFTITAGKAVGYNAAKLNGENVHRGHGGGIYLNKSSPVLINLNIHGNKSRQGGGGICNYNTSSPAITNSVIWNNEATTGAKGGGIYFDTGSNAALTNLTIAGNKSSLGGGGICYATAVANAVSIRNSVVWGNVSTSGEADMAVDLVTSLPVFSHSLVGNWTLPGTGNLSGTVNPLFVNEGSKNYRLSGCSPLINKGRNSDISFASLDLDHNTRIYNGTVDIGAYEYQNLSLIPTAVISGNQTICFGSTASVSITLTGASPWTIVTSNGEILTIVSSDLVSGVYTWSVSPVVNTTYTLVSVVDANCSGIVSGNVDIVINAKPSITVVSPTVVCAPATVDITGTATGAVTYKYYEDNNNTVGVELGSTIFNGAQITNYWVIGYSAEGCASDSVKGTVTIKARPVYPDLRLQVCPESGVEVNLTSYLDQRDFVSVTWTNPHGISIVADKVNAADLAPAQTYQFKYSVENSCETDNISQGVLYIRALDNRGIVFYPPDTVTICVDNAEYIVLNQIMGAIISSGGTWHYGEINSSYTDYITDVNGAIIFNGKKAYNDGKGTNHGTIPSAKQITFTYTIPPSLCNIPTVYTLTIVLRTDSI